ncbi:class II aldolase/adducin family protein [Virgibacillus sp.]|uniref:class II aldolase/adducin family protein n=1 Tax=Virgibacillus sp. TaxID=1872700 RepID=UPI00179EF742|nr:class II aldolase/adducin family protein [Virgibacillus sp.]NWO12594.1 class II aldolase/adducin family protein [Virgibacillus sp.]
MKYLKEERKQIVAYGKKLIDAGLTVGTGGNISIFDKEAGLMGITPSGIDYHQLREQDIIIMDLYGNVVEGELKPSSEFQMHSIVYKNRCDVTAMVHTHALKSSLFISNSRKGEDFDAWIFCGCRRRGNGKGNCLCCFIKWLFC